MSERYRVKRGDFDGPVLVTGAGGCVGAWVSALLAQAGVQVVAFDRRDDQRRLRLLLEDAGFANVTWQTGDVADAATVSNLVAGHGVQAIIHLAALVLGACRANPGAGAQVNVVGTTNVLEAARHAGIKRLAYASSLAVVCFEPDNTWQESLYGAYKVCNEQTARVYFQDWGVPSICIRPGVVYGVGRDEGLTATPTNAILAAAAGRPYNIPFRGALSALHGREIAAAFIRAVAQDRTEAAVFDLNGRATSVEEWLDILTKIAPDAQITVSGAPLRFPFDISDKPIRDYLGDYGQVPLEEGMRDTYAAFQDLLARGLVSAEALD